MRSMQCCPVMDHQLLESFVAVAEELHFGRAADRLHLAQPALSRAIRRLESDVGADLFRRTTRSVELTRAGHALVQPARTTLRALQEARRAVIDAEGGRVGRVRIGYAGPSSHMQVAALVRDVHTEEPGIALTLRSMTYGALSVQQVRDGVLDLAIARWRFPHDELKSRVIAHDRPVFVVPAQHDLATRSTLRAADLRDVPLVVLPRSRGSELRTQVTDLCEAAGFQPTVAQVAPDTWTAIALVSVGVGLCLTLESAVAHVPAEKTVVVPLEGATPVEARLIWRAEDTSPSLARVLSVGRGTLGTSGSDR